MASIDCSKRRRSSSAQPRPLCHLSQNLHNHLSNSPVLYRSPWLREEGEEEEGEPPATTAPIAETLASAVAALVEAEVEGKKKKTSSSPRPALSAALARALCVAARSDRPTAGEAEILSAEPSEGAEPESAVPSSSSKAAAAAASSSAEERERPRPRILILAATPASREAYIPLMNCVFAAQRLRVTVDVCELVEGAAGAERSGKKKGKRGAAAATTTAAAAGGEGGWGDAAEEVGANPKQKQQQQRPATSTLLSQAAHLTGGVVVSPFALSSSSNPSSTSSPALPLRNAAASLLQTLLAVFAPGGQVRRWLSLPKTGAVDMRASCFCHKVQRERVGWLVERERERERDGSATSTFFTLSFSHSETSKKLQKIKTKQKL